MIEPWLQRIFDRIAACGLSRAETLRRAGLANSTFNDWKNGHKPSYENLEAVLAVIGWSRENLDGDTSKIGIVLSTSYEILGGEMFAPARGKPKEVPLALFDANLVSLEVVTNDYYPRYRMGDIVSGPRQEKNFHNLIGSECIAEGRDGTRYFKKLGKRDPKGRYTLQSIDGRQGDIDGIDLKWVAPVKIIYRP